MCRSAYLKQTTFFFGWQAVKKAWVVGGRGAPCIPAHALQPLSPALPWDSHGFGQPWGRVWPHGGAAARRHVEEGDILHCGLECR